MIDVHVADQIGLGILVVAVTLLLLGVIGIIRGGGR